MASTLFGRPSYAYDSERLVVEVANSVFAVRNHISLTGLRQLWNGLANFINISLKSHKVGEHPFLEARGNPSRRAGPRQARSACCCFVGCMTHLTWCSATGSVAASTWHICGGPSLGRQVCHVQTMAAYLQPAGWAFWGRVTGAQQVQTAQ